MVLSKLAVKLYPILLEVGLWLLLFAAFIQGWRANGFVGAIIGLITAAIFGAVFLGAFLVINDIRDTVRSIDSKK